MIRCCTYTAHWHAGVQQRGVILLQIALFSRLTTEVLLRRTAKQYDEESLKLAAKLLEQNPELYTVWNYRREALQDKLQVSKMTFSDFLKHATHVIGDSSPLL